MKKKLLCSCISWSGVFLTVLLLFACDDTSKNHVSLNPTRTSTTQNETIPLNYGYNIIQTYPHDSQAFTQGLVIENGNLYESTGRYGHSSVRQVDLNTGKVLKIHNLAKELFGEGLTVFNDQIVQLTLEAKTGFVYEPEHLEILQTFSYNTQGWGITHDGTHLIMSDGSSILRFLDPISFEVLFEIQVYDANVEVSQLNELEYIQGEIYANVWDTDRIVKISPKTGQVLGWIDLQNLLPAEDREQGVDVLNGIAYDKEQNRLFVTGKLWPKLFEIELVPE
jgi:glutamine cyclotransferase